MELIEKIKAIIGRLEGFKKQRNPNLDSLKEQIDIIENEELLKLDEEFDEWRNNLYDEGEPDGETDDLIDKIGDLFIQADELIATIRQQFGIEDLYDDIDEQDGDELIRSIYDDAEEDDDDSENDEYDVVLDEISKSALKTIGLDNDDSQSIGLMGSILLGISSGESDDAIAGRTFAQLAMSGFMLPMDEIKKFCKDTREKCKKQLFGLQIAMNSLREYHCSAEEALTQIAVFI